jgi:AcrR family transcriptional regulator
MTEYTSRGDPRRTMDLLWGRNEAPARGPKQGLTVAEIVAAAIEVADQEGLSAVSMRKVAERLGRSPMGLYTYVPGKAELLDLMLDAVHGELPTEYDRSDGWRAAAERCARAHWDFYERHPWVLQASGSRAVLGPHVFDDAEAQLRLFDGLGLRAVEVSWSASVLSTYVSGAAKVVSDARAAERDTGISDDDWWNARAPLLEERFQSDECAGRYPTMTRLSEEHAFDQLDRPDDTTPYLVQEALDTFEFGLQRLLDGLEAYVASRKRPRQSGRRS